MGRWTVNNSSKYLKSDPFAKYMKPVDPNKAHAELSASGSERWLGCPASVKLSRGRPKIEHASAQVGTNAHTLLQFILENPGTHYRLLMSPEARKFKDFIDYSTEQHDAVMTAAHFVWATQKESAYKRGGIPPELFVEQKVKLDGVGFGTADIILYEPFGLLHIMDFKNGKYKVDAKENTQGLYYAVAAADKFGWDFSDVMITIIQPNAPHANGPIRAWKTTPERLEKAQRMFLRGAARTKEKNPAVVPDNKYCWFCPTKPVCPAHVEIRREKIVGRFERPTPWC